MRISVTDAKGRLTDLVKRAEAGDELLHPPGGLPLPMSAGVEAFTRLV
jgi:hypothetical protein